MRHSVRSCLTLSVAAMTAATIAFTPSAKQSAPVVPTVPVATHAVALVAQVQPSATAGLPNLLIDWFQRIAIPPSAGQPFPTPHFPPVVAPTSIGSSIRWIYDTVEPWVRYGFDLAAYAVGWVPYVGWLAPQITIFYNFGERIAQSITYNIADWLDGRISFGQGLVNVGIDTINSFIFLANDQLAFWLPPLPPIPPIGPLSAAQASTAMKTALASEVATTESPDLAAESKLNEKHSAVAATDEVTVKGGKEPDVDAVKETKETTSPKTGVAAQGEVRGDPNETTTESPKGLRGAKKGDKGPTAADTTQSSTESSATNDDTAAKPKHETGKKDKGDK